MQPNAADAICHLDGSPLLPALGFSRGKRENRKLGGIEVARLRGPLRWSAADDSVCHLIFQCAAHSALSVDRGLPAFMLSPGDWIARVSPAFEIQTWRGSEVLSLAFPSALLSRNLLPQVRGAPDVATLTTGAAQMCLELARTCIAQAEPVSEAVSGTLGDTLVELAKLAMIEQSGSQGGETVRETVRTRIVGLINRNLTDPDLTIERIAERMQCTKRYLHKVFSEDGETLNQYIWTRRLDLCRTRLVRPDLSAKSITEIAFACGFSNAAHFSRSFRARFGQSPRSFRRAAIQR